MSFERAGETGLPNDRRGTTGPAGVRWATVQ